MPVEREGEGIGGKVVRYASRMGNTARRNFKGFEEINESAYAVIDGGKM